MDSFVSASNDTSAVNCKTESKKTKSNFNSVKGSSSFVFSAAKSPLTSSKNTTSQNQILKNSSYSTSKIKGSFISNKPSDTSSVVKYNSFITSCKLSPSRAKSSKRIVKKSQRKLDMNLKQKSSCGHRKKSSSSKGGQSKVSTSIATSCKHKVSYKQLTRNPSKVEGFDCNYSALMDTYTDLMSKKRNDTNKLHK